MKYALSITLCCSCFFLYESGLAAAGETHSLNSGFTSNGCMELITWKIGSLDSRYKLEEESLKNIMAKVSKLWSHAVGRKLFAYSDSGVVTVNLIYSDIQKYTEDKQQIVSQIHEMKRKYALMRMKHLEELRKLENEVDKPHNPLPQYLAKVNRYNELSEELNGYANEVNNVIDQYESRFLFRKTFYQATFNNFDDPKRINIYQFENIDNLKRVLTHEAGHVLGLTHTDSPQAIMNSRMKFHDEKKLQLTNEDIRKIRNRCPRLTYGEPLIENELLMNILLN